MENKIEINLTAPYWMAYRDNKMSIVKKNNRKSGIKKYTFTKKIVK